MNQSILKTLAAGLLGAALILMLGAPVLAHHSFAMYDQTVEKTLTGKITRYIPGSNHAQIIFELVDNNGQTVMENGRPVQWGVETSSAAQLARSGVTQDAFPNGTIITVSLNPLRDGRTFGAMTNTAGRLIKCGNTMPSGGCTAQTGQVFLGGD